MLLDVTPVVYLCDAIVDVVDSEMYLGNKLYNNIYKAKINELVCDFERRRNQIIHIFSMCDSFHGGKLYVIFFNFLLELICLCLLMFVQLHLIGSQAITG